MNTLDIEHAYNNNLKLIHFLCNNFRSTGIEYDELFSIANLTFVIAFNSYNKNKGTFQTFFRKCFKNAVLNELKKRRQTLSYSMNYSSTYSIDNYILIDLSDSQKTILKLLFNGFSQKEIAKHLGISQPRVSQMLKKLRREINEKRIL